MTTLYLAVYDPYSRNPSGTGYWSWSDEHIPQDVLGGTWSVVSQAVTGGAGHGDQFANRDRDVDHFGIVTLDDEWCCYFRVVERGLDVHRRPGRYAVLCGFTKRVFSLKQNPELVWERLVCDRLPGDTIANLPVPRPQQTLITLPPGAIVSDFSAVERMGDRDQIHCPDNVTWDEFCHACGTLPRDGRWTVLVKQQGSNRTGTIRCLRRSGKMARPSDPIRQAATPGQDLAPSKPHKKPSWRRLLPLLLLLGSYSIGILTGAIVVLSGSWYLTPTSNATSSPENAHVKGSPDPRTPLSGIVSSPLKRGASEVDFSQIFLPAMFSSSVAFLLGLVGGNITRVYFGWQVPWVNSENGPR